MPQPVTGEEDRIQSFVLRTWEEEPGELRGTIVHVQSRAQRGFSRLGQADEFVRRHVGQSILEDAGSPSGRRRFWPAFRPAVIGSRQLRLVGIASAVLLASLVVVLLGAAGTDLALGPTRGVSGFPSRLAGAAVGQDDILGGWFAFLFGVLTGGGIVVAWYRLLMGGAERPLSQKRKE